MNPLERKFQILADTWRKGLREETKRSAIAFFILILLTFGACLLFPQLREMLVERVVQLFGSLEITSGGGLPAMTLFSNNLRACVFTMIYGMFPFIHLSAFALGMNAMLLGVMAAYHAAGGSSLLVFLASLLPHSLFELPALILAFGMGLYTCDQITRRWKHDPESISAFDSLAMIGWLLMLVQIPLLAAAAYLEANVTPLLLSLVL